jgi:hypothetical protein
MNLNSPEYKQSLISQLMSEREHRTNQLNKISHGCNAKG